MNDAVLPSRLRESSKRYEVACKVCFPIGSSAAAVAYVVLQLWLHNDAQIELRTTTNAALIYNLIKGQLEVFR